MNRKKPQEMSENAGKIYYKSWISTDEKCTDWSNDKLWQK